MWPVCYSSWFIWRNSIPCTRCNVISLEHGWTHDEQIHRESMLMPLLFTSYKNYVRSSKSFQESWNWMEDLNICQKPLDMDKLCFVRLLRLIWKIPKRRHSRRQYLAFFLSSLCCLKIYFKPSPYTGNSVVKKWDWNHWPHYWIKPIHVIDMTLTLTYSLMRLMHSNKNRWCCLRVVVSLVTGKPTKICFEFWW